MLVNHKSLKIILFFLIFSYQSINGEDNFQGESRIEFFGTSTEHNFTGKVKSEPFSANVNKLSNDKLTIQNMQVNVMVEKMDTGEHLMNENMFRMFNSKTYPQIHGTFSTINLNDKMLSFKLNLHNVEKTIQADMEGSKIDHDRIEFSLNFPISLKEFNLKPPTFFGIWNVGDIVKVKAHFILKKKV